MRDRERETGEKIDVMKECVNIRLRDKLEHQMLAHSNY